MLTVTGIISDQMWVSNEQMNNGFEIEFISKMWAVEDLRLRN